MPVFDRSTLGASSCACTAVDNRSLIRQELSFNSSNEYRDRISLYRLRKVRHADVRQVISRACGVLRTQHHFRVLRERRLARTEVE